MRPRRRAGRPSELKLCSRSSQSGIQDGGVAPAGECVVVLVEGIFVGGPKALRDERGEWTSSIARKRVDGPVRLSIEGLDGDKVTEPYHGGPEAAICVHLADHYAFWRAQYGIEFCPGHLGDGGVVPAMTSGEQLIPILRQHR